MDHGSIVGLPFARLNFYHCANNETNNGSIERMGRAINRFFLSPAFVYRVEKSSESATFRQDKNQWKRSRHGRSIVDQLNILSKGM